MAVSLVPLRLGWKRPSVAVSTPHARQTGWYGAPGEGSSLLVGSSGRRRNCGTPCTPPCPRRGGRTPLLAADLHTTQRPGYRRLCLSSSAILSNGVQDMDVCHRYVSISGAWIWTTLPKRPGCRHRLAAAFAAACHDTWVLSCSATALTPSSRYRRTLVHEDTSFRLTLFILDGKRHMSKACTLLPRAPR